MTDSPVTPPATPVSPPAGQRKGWYRDPWSVAPWRWWDGRTWTANTNTVSQRKPRLPSWLSAPVLTGSVPSTAVAIYTAIGAPVAILLGFTPIVLVAPALLWIDRLEPEPWSSRLHALLWGGFVAGIIGLASNTIVAFVSSDGVAAVVSAPISEEIGKGLGVLWAVRRKELDGVMDGLVYAGWIGLGFAIIEDFGYFAYADDSGTLFQVFVGRALLTPFVHPLFTAWIGLAVGLSVAKRLPLRTAWWGLVLAIGTHMAWNAALLAVGTEDSDDTIGGGEATASIPIIMVMLLFVVFFAGAAGGVVWLRRRDAQHFAKRLPWLARRYQLPSSDLERYRSWPVDRSMRSRLSPPARRHFDRRRAVLARLAALHDQPGEPDLVLAGRLVTNLADLGATYSAPEVVVDV